MSDYYDKGVYDYTGKLDAKVPEVADAWEHFNQSVFSAEGREIPLRYRELMAVAVALTTQCVYCIETHMRRAKRAGATEVELAEASWVATAIRGGGGYAHGVLMTRLDEGHRH